MKAIELKLHALHDSLDDNRNTRSTPAVGWAASSAGWDAGQRENAPG